MTIGYVFHHSGKRLEPFPYLTASFMGIMTQTVVLYMKLGRLLYQLCDVASQTETTITQLKGHVPEDHQNGRSLTSASRISDNTSRKIYQSHKLKSKDGKIICPILRRYISLVCGATRDSAHTRHYCQQELPRSTVSAVIVMWKV
uniref:Nanos-type domain-containing protein n=1 Tax=Salmo trutta TaxID=8032 RepID=A0A674D753_SALTR